MFLYQCCLFPFHSYISLLLLLLSLSCMLHVNSVLTAACCMDSTKPHPSHLLPRTLTHQCRLQQQLYHLLSAQSRSACRSLPRKCTSSHQQSCMLPKSLLAEVTGYDNIHNIMSKNTVHCVYVINTHMYTLLWICTLTIIVVVIPSMKMFYLLFFSLILTFVPPSLFLFIYNPHFSQFVSLSLVIIIPETK